jgi:hypothetical protein
VKRIFLSLLALAALLPAAIDIPVWAQSETFTNFVLAAPGGAPTNNDIIPCIEGSGASFATKQCTPPLLLALLTSAQVKTALGYTPLNPANNLADVLSATSSRVNLGLSSQGYPSSTVFLQASNNLLDVSNTTTSAGNLGVFAILDTSTQNGLAFYSQTGTVAGLAAAANGQIPIGRTGNSPVLATLTPGYAVSTTNGSGSITQAVALTALSVSLTSDVTLSNTSTFFDGPSIPSASTTAGLWQVMGTLTLLGPTGGDRFQAKLWDGTNVFASGEADLAPTQNIGPVMSLSGVTTSTPLGNLRISVIDLTHTNGIIKWNQSGNQKDSTITAVRIQ